MPDMLTLSFQIVKVIQNVILTISFFDGEMTILGDILKMKSAVTGLNSIIRNSEVYTILYNMNFVGHS